MLSMVQESSIQLSYYGNQTMENRDITLSTRRDKKKTASNRAIMTFTLWKINKTNVVERDKKEVASNAIMAFRL